MTSELEFLVMIALVFIAVIFWIASKQQTEVQTEAKNSKRTKLTSNEIIDTLDWMLAHNIITNQEYNRMIAKSLPFLE